MIERKYLLKNLEGTDIDKEKFCPSQILLKTNSDSQVRNIQNFSLQMTVFVLQNYNYLLHPLP